MKAIKCAARSNPELSFIVMPPDGGMSVYYESPGRRLCARGALAHNGTQTSDGQGGMSAGCCVPVLLSAGVAACQWHASSNDRSGT